MAGFELAKSLVIHTCPRENVFQLQLIGNLFKVLMFIKKKLLQIHTCLKVGGLAN